MPILDDHPYLLPLLKLARRAGTKVYLIGGFLRDHLLNRPGLDLDFAVEKDAVRLARKFARQIQGAFVLLDAENGCARVVKKLSSSRTVTLDFADYRAPTLKRDLAHRDFTVNTFCVDIDDLEDGGDLKKIIRDHRGGKKDLKLKKVRMTSSSVFREDPLRLLRAFSMSAVLGFRIDALTLKRIIKDKRLLRESSAERVRDELFKILASPRAYATLRAMDRIGLLEQVIPQVVVMYDVHQGGYHHLDVWRHTLETVRQFEGLMEEMKEDREVMEYLSCPIVAQRPRHALIKLALLMHDIGKPQTRKQEGERMTFHGHEHVGREISRVVAKALKLSTVERRKLEDMVQLHLRPGYLSNFKQPSERAVFRFLRDAGEEATAVLLLSIADQRSTRGPLTTEEDQEHHRQICLKVLRGFFVRKNEKPLVRLVTGNDLIRILKLKPSPLFARILMEIEEQQATGKITKKDEALALARQVAERKGSDDQGPRR